MKFNLSEFARPPSDRSPGYFWSLNDKLEKKELFKQLHDMHAHGARTVCVHPMPPEFRPSTMATKMEPTYLGRKYFELLREVFDEGARLDMNFYLYDEGAWPSGGGGRKGFRAQSGQIRPQVGAL